MANSPKTRQQFQFHKVQGSEIAKFKTLRFSFFLRNSPNVMQEPLLPVIPAIQTFSCKRGRDEEAPSTVFTGHVLFRREKPSLYGGVFSSASGFRVAISPARKNGTYFQYRSSWLRTCTQYHGLARWGSRRRLNFCAASHSLAPSCL